ncbi:MAG: hypothetical protein [Bacteriophage sp.]|nr:MAG: hypothetical protein [Bacteriophage sp.]
MREETFLTIICVIFMVVINVFVLRKIQNTYLNTQILRVSAILFAMGNVIFISALFYEKLDAFSYGSPIAITSVIWDNVTLSGHKYHFNIMLCIGFYLMVSGILLKTIIRCINKIYYWVKRA